MAKETSYFPAYHDVNAGDKVMYGGKVFMYVPVSSKYGVGKYVSCETRDPDETLDDTVFTHINPVISVDTPPDPAAGQKQRVINHSLDLKTIDSVS